MAKHVLTSYAEVEVVGEGRKRESVGWVLNTQRYGVAAAISEGMGESKAVVGSWSRKQS